MDANVLRAWRHAQGWTQRETAQYFRVDQDTVWRWERGDGANIPPMVELLAYLYSHAICRRKAQEFFQRKLTEAQPRLWRPGKKKKPQPKH